MPDIGVRATVAAIKTEARDVSLNGASVVVYIEKGCTIDATSFPEQIPVCTLYRAEKTDGQVTF